MPEWCGVIIRFTCANMYETISIWEDAKRTLADGERSFIFNNWNLVDATDIRTINPTTFQETGFEPWPHDETQFMQLLPLFCCKSVVIKYVARAMGYIGCVTHSQNDNGDWESSDVGTDTFYDDFNTYN